MKNILDFGKNIIIRPIIPFLTLHHLFRRNHGQLSTLNSPLEDNLINCIIANQISRYRKLITSTTTRLLIQSNTVDDKTRPRPKQNDIIVRLKIESGVINDIGLRRSNSLPPQGSQEGGN